MARVLGLDLGDRKTGVALSDPDGRMAFPHSVIRGDPVPQVQALVREHGIRTVIVGRPLGLTGAATQQTELTDRTVQRLSVVLGDGVEIIRVDERLSSRRVQSERAVLGLSRRTRRESDDAEAAALLLADYLTPPA